ncbi:methyltransferase family protein [Clostridium tyrobutyricum]|uniref:methyltransferase family protein n=1 Tax=Clostridium tyrobutyricum TaxID=1519 RepID=UPI001C38686B|nr:isoprenylcysteine carboxylmethyltransferase family protein [Clostridium tyrobutyricum]MBV4427446.1 isoprenylcysteine carboxylmethyltransferase family protein [Clostridium tyrobutyricum]MBV4443748.1 isoprenylcysteine carboxylmethyltransferase family protein [Clostridium tyrobutyricum]
MNLFGNLYFDTVGLKNIFQAVFIFFIISEMLIWIFTCFYSKRQSGNRESRDKGSYLVLVLGFIAVIYLNPFCRRMVHILLPDSCFVFGLFLIIIGVLLRAVSVWTLRKFFTLSVQMNSEQKIVQNGIYKYIRHPAYSGSILSLVGISLCFRSIIGLAGTIIIIFVIYGYRIKIEEKMLENRFGMLYREYKKKTYKIIPFIF